MAILPNNQATVRQIDNEIDAAQSKYDRTIDGTFDRNKYNVTDMVYPQDLLSNDGRYGSNYAVFFINVSEATRAEDAYGNKLGAADYVPDFDKRVQTSIAESNLSNTEIIAGVAGQNLLAGAGLGAIGALLRGNFSGALQGGMIAGAIATAPVALLAATGVKTQKGKKRLKRAIMLHMPNDIKSTYSMQYGTVDLKNFAIGAEVADILTDAVKVLANDPTNLSGSVDKLRTMGANPARALALSMPNAEGVQAATGLVPNPRQEVLFGGVDFRSFAMQYQFFPRNQQEMNLILNIIQEFKYHMHPDYLDPKKFVYVYPSEFDITFYHKDKDNDMIPKISSCALVNMVVDYTPNGVWNSTADGAPTQINVALHFKELATLTKEAIQKGY